MTLDSKVAAKKIYFLSDFHLGVPTHEVSIEREKKIVRFLDSIKKDTAELFLLGDAFDFWFEYKYAVPKGHIRLLGKLAEFTDSGIPVHYFTGNHDMWMFDYLPAEIGLKLYRQPITRTIDGKVFFIGHGDGLGPGDYGYKFIKKIFANKFSQWLFARFYPNFGISLANFWSRRSRISTGTTDDKYLGDDKEFLVKFIKDKLKTEKVDYFIFGHRHLPINMNVESAQYTNLGDWVKYYTYAEWDGKTLSLLEYK